VCEGFIFGSFFELVFCGSLALQECEQLAIGAAIATEFWRQGQELTG
jgi:hypothetical protein